ncbi:MAG: OmpA family protein [Blastocatellia bacterium]
MKRNLSVSRRRRGESAEGASEHRDRWLISYADLVTLLFALFVVLYAAADKDRARSVAEAINRQTGSPVQPEGGLGVLPGGNSLAATQAAIDRVLANNPMLRSRTRVTKTGNGLVISLAEAGFFAPGEATVRDDARSMVDQLADAIREADTASGETRPLRVEGHTDSTPIATSRYPSNWELSSARASSVLAQLIGRGIQPARLSLAGYAGERPVADNSTIEGRALNRRVDLVILNGQAVR